MSQQTLKGLNRVNYLVESYDMLKEAHANVAQRRGNPPLGFSALILDFGSKRFRVGTQFLEGFLEEEIKRVKHALEESGFNTDTLGDKVPDIDRGEF